MWLIQSSVYYVYTRAHTQSTGYLYESQQYAIGHWLFCTLAFRRISVNVTIDRTYRSMCLRSFAFVCVLSVIAVCVCVCSTVCTASIFIFFLFYLFFVFLVGLVLCVGQPIDTDFVTIGWCRLFVADDCGAMPSMHLIYFHFLCAWFAPF